MNRDIVKVGIIGCGWISENAHIPSLLSIPNVEISSLFDAEIGRAENLAQKFDVCFYTNDINEFLKKDIDAVIVATPNNTHKYYSMLALKNGLNVLCEKPIAIFEEDVIEVVECGKAHKKVFMAGFVNRFRYDTQAILSFLRNKEIGRINRLDAAWLRKCGVPRPGSWFTNKKLSGGGVLIDLGPHIIDLCLLFSGADDLQSCKTLLNFDRESLNKFGASWFASDNKNSIPIDLLETFVSSEMHFENNITVNLKLSWLSPLHGDGTMFKIYGSEGSIELKTLFGFSQNRLWKSDSLIINKYCDKSSILVPLDRKFNNTYNAFRNMLQSFVDKCRNGEISDDDYSFAIKNVKIISDLYNNFEIFKTEKEYLGALNFE